MQGRPLILSRHDLRKLLPMTDVIEAVERGFCEYKTGQCIVPVRMSVPIEKSDGAYTPEMRELDDLTIRRSKIIVDTYEG